MQLLGGEQLHGVTIGLDDLGVFSQRPGLGQQKYVRKVQQGQVIPQTVVGKFGVGELVAAVPLPVKQRGHRTRTEFVKIDPLQELLIVQAGGGVAGEAVQPGVDGVPGVVDDSGEEIPVHRDGGYGVKLGVVPLAATHLTGDGRDGVKEKKRVHLPADHLSLGGFIPANDLNDERAVKNEFFRRGSVLKQLFGIPSLDQFLRPRIVRQAGRLQVKGEQKRCIELGKLLIFHIIG